MTIQTSSNDTYRRFVLRPSTLRRLVRERPDVVQMASITIVLVVLWIAFTFSSQYFLTEVNVTNIFLQSAVVGILAAAFSVTLIAGEIDLSIASVQALAATLAAVLVIQKEWSIPATIVAVLLLGAVIGAANGYLTMIVRIPSFIATLAMLGIAQGLAFVLTGGRTISGFPDSYSVIGRGYVGPVPVAVIIAASIYLVLHVLLTQSKLGLHIYAVGGARHASRLVGLPTVRVVITVFVLSGVLASLAGIVLSSRLNAGQGNFGASSLLDAVAAVVIGGTSLFGGAGRIVGTAVGVLMISTIRNGLILNNVDPFWQQVVVGCLILGSVTLDQLIKGNVHPRDLVLLGRHG